MSERAPLLGSISGGHPATAGPTLKQSVRWFFLNSYINALLVFVPLGYIAEKLEWSALARFSLNFLAIVPLAKLLGDATEQVSILLGPTLGALLNASFVRILSPLFFPSSCRPELT